MTTTDHLRLLLLTRAGCHSLFTPSETNLNGDAAEHQVCFGFKQSAQRKESQDVSIDIGVPYGHA
jgi:hypothetical protein